MIATTAIPQGIDYESREAWLLARQRGIGASDTAGIFGVGYAEQSPITIWESKVNPPRDSFGNEKSLRIGKLMEPALRAILSEEIGLEVQEPGEFTIYQHEQHPWLTATLDGFVLHPEYGFCPTELKNVSNFARADWGDDETPLKFQVQCQQQIAVTGASHAYLLGLIGGNQPVVKMIERNDRFIDAMIARLEEFWGYVERRQLPPVDESAATGRALARLFPVDDGGSIYLADAEAAEWARELEEAKATIKDAEKLKTAAANKLEAAIGNNTFADFPDGTRYSWKQQTRKAYYVEEASFRVLRKCK